MIYILPLYSDKTARWTSEIDLSGKRYLLYFSWNTCCEYWEFSICNDDNNLLVGGIKLVTNIDLLDEYRNYSPNLPKGKLSLINKDDVTESVTRENLNLNYMLIYNEE